MLDVTKALAEVQEKSQADIECETAYVWGSRAVACYGLFKATNDVSWYVRATHYRDEALEHAAMVGDHGKFVGHVQRMIDD